MPEWVDFHGGLLHFLLGANVPEITCWQVPHSCLPFADDRCRCLLFPSLLQKLLPFDLLPQVCSLQGLLTPPPTLLWALTVQGCSPGEHTPKGREAATPSPRVSSPTPGGRAKAAAGKQEMKLLRAQLRSLRQGGYLKAPHPGDTQRESEPMV